MQLLILFFKSCIYNLNSSDVYMYKNNPGLFVENTEDIYRYLTINETYFKTLTIETLKRRK